MAVDQKHTTFNGISRRAQTITPTDGAAGDVRSGQAWFTAYFVSGSDTAGIVAITTLGGDEVLHPFSVGAMYPIELSRVRRTGTTNANVRVNIYGNW